MIRAAAISALLFATTVFAVNAGFGEVPATVQRNTPFAATQGFFEAAHAGDYQTAAHYLEIDRLGEKATHAEGARLARRLKFVLDRMLPLDLSRISTDPNGDPETQDYDQLGTIPLDKQSIPIRLRRVDNQWVFSDETVRGIDRLYDAYGPPFGERLPEGLFHYSLLGIEAWQWLGLLVVLVLAVVLSLLIERGFLFVGRRMARMTLFAWDDAFVESGRGPGRIPFFCAVIGGGSRFLLMPGPAQRLIDTLIRSLLIICLAWFLLRFLRRGAEQLTGKVAQGTGSRERGIQTQLVVLRRVFEICIYVVGGALLLIQFEVVRNVGVSLLASAGIAGLVVGLAAQKSIGALLAGIQLSVTQPVRIGDMVNIDGEVGTVEEITLTYVIIRVWDLRRLVVPVTYFLENKFQNWSRRELEMLGTVTLETDWRVDVEAVRVELQRLLQNDAAALWDTKVGKVEVTESQARTCTLRVLVSARTPGELWDLRCLLRERLIHMLKKHPEWLPTVRVDGDEKPAAAAHT